MIPKPRKEEWNEARTRTLRTVVRASGTLIERHSRPLVEPPATVILPEQQDKTPDKDA